MKNIINRKAYLSHAKAITPIEQNLITEYQKWLPDLFIDCHAHCNLHRHVNYIDDRAFRHMLSTFPSFNLKESKEWNSFFHPKKKILSLRFPCVFKGIDHKKANSYLFEQSSKCDRIALYGLSDDIDYTIKSLHHPRVSALKMYHSYPNPTAKKIYQYFPKKVLKVAEKKNIPIILHPPLPIVESISQIFRLLDDFPNLKICLAHMGLTKSLTIGLEKALVSLAPCSLVMFDTAQVSSADVIEAALLITGQNRVMYGSDAPVNLIRSVAYEHPQYGRRIVTEYPYHWVEKKEQETYKHLAVGAMHNHWGTLNAIKDAISRLPQNYQEDAKKKIFYFNAKIFYGFNEVS